MKILSAKKTLRTGKISQFIFKLPILPDRNYTKQTKICILVYQQYPTYDRVIIFFFFAKMHYKCAPQHFFTYYSSCSLLILYLYAMFPQLDGAPVSILHYAASQDPCLVSDSLFLEPCLVQRVECLQNEELNKQNSVFSLFSTHKSKVEKSLNLFGSFRNQNQTPKSLFSESTLVIILFSWSRIGVGNRFSSPLADDHHSSSNPVEHCTR